MRGKAHRHVDVQISASFKIPRGYHPSADLVRDAVRYRLEHGHDHKLVRVRIVAWNTSDGVNGRPNNAQAESDAFKRFRRLLQAAHYRIDTF